MTVEHDRLVTFTLGGETFALGVDVVREVVPIAWLARPPNMPRAVEGVLDLGGQAVPVLRLDRLLGLAEGTHGLDASILIMRENLGRNGQPMGLLVDHVDGVRPVTAFTRMPLAPEQSFNGCVAALLGDGDGAWHLLSWDRILLAEERARLVEFQARAQERLAEPMPQS